MTANRLPIHGSLSPSPNRWCSALRCACAAALLFCSQCSVCGAEPLPAEVTVYFSREDPHWQDAQKTIDAAARLYPAMKVTKITIDDNEGYAQLADVEQKLRIIPPGDLTVVIAVTYPAPPDPQVSAAEQKPPRGKPRTTTEQIALVSRQEQRDVEKCFASLVKRLLDPSDGKGRLEPDVAAFAAEVFGHGARVEAGVSPKDEHFRYHPVLEAGQRRGWVVDVFHHVGCPTCNDMQFLMAVSVPDSKVLLIRPQRDLERLAVKVDHEEAAGFLAQFKGRTPQTSQVKADALAGVTKTCRLYESTIRDALAEIQKREKP